MTDFYRQLRKLNCIRVSDQLRQAALESDNANHDLREVAFHRWLLDNIAVFHEVAGVLANVAGRREWR